MKDLFLGFSLTGSAALALVIPWVIFKACRAVCLKKNYEALQNKTVVITGASGGLGEALAHEFYRKGCQVVLCARRKDELERVKQSLLNTKLIKTPPVPLVLPLDLTDIASIPKVVASILSHTKIIDILINNGGISNRGSVLETDPEVHIKVMTVNYFGSLAMTKAVLPSMVKNKSGHVVFVGSVQGLISIPHRSAYGASKHALQAFADSLRAEIATHNVQVTVASPGYIKTDISKNALTGSGVVYGKMDETTEKGYTPEYVAEVISMAVAQKQKEVVIAPLIPRLAIFIRSFIPSAYFYIMTKRARKES